MFLKILQNVQENTFIGFSFLIKLHASDFIEKRDFKQVFPCEFGEIFKDTFFCIIPPVAPYKYMKRKAKSVIVSQKALLLIIIVIE